jgi:signal peptidase
MFRRRSKALPALLAPVAVATLLGLYVFGAIPYRVYVIHTGSMSPTIPPRSAVLVREGRYQPGQVIAFRRPGGIVTHRLVSLNADGTLNTKGDANRSLDPWRVQRRDVIGGVVLAPHMVGFALVYLRSPLGAASLALAFLLTWQTGGIARLARTPRVARS